MPEVEGALRERRGDLGGCESQEAGVLPDLGVGGGGDDAASFATEDATVLGGPVLCDVLAEDLDQFWWMGTGRTSCLPDAGGRVLRGRSRCRSTGC